MHSTPVEFGGAGFSQKEIGLVLGARGVCGILLQLFAFPPLCNGLGPALTFRSCLALYPLIFLLFPLIGLAAKSGETGLVWTGLVVSMLLWATANMAFSANMLLITNSAPSRADLGTLHGA